MQADATVAPTCIDIIYILHVYLSLCVITIYCKCVSTNKYCLLSIVYCIESIDFLCVYKKKLHLGSKILYCHIFTCLLIHFTTD